MFESKKKHCFFLLSLLKIEFDFIEVDKYENVDRILEWIEKNYVNYFFLNIDSYSRPDLERDINNKYKMAVHEEKPSQVR